LIQISQGCKKDLTNASSTTRKRRARINPTLCSEVTLGKSMIESIKKLFGLDYENQLKKERDKYLSSLPKPSSKIVICSHNYNPQVYNCDVIVESSDLLDWLEYHFSRCSISLNADVFLSWLPTANLNDKEPTYLDKNLLSVIEGYEDRLMETGKAKIICGLCRNIFDSINQYRENAKDEGNWHSGTIVWKCPDGHKIYHNDYRFHALKRES